MEVELDRLIERKDIPNDVRVTLEKVRVSYINHTREFNEAKGQIMDLIEDYPVGILEVDIRNKQVIFANKIVCERTGYTKEELLSLDPFDLLPEENQDYFIKRQITLLSGEDITPKPIEFKVKKKDGSLFWVSARTKFTFNNQQTIERATMVLSDITDQKKAEEALHDTEEKYSTLFHFSNDAIFLHDLQGNILDANQRVLELFDYTKAEILSLKIHDLYPFDMFDASESAFKTITKRRVAYYEIDFIKKGGKRFPAEVSSNLITIRDQKLIQEIVRDITERKRTEEVLRASEEKYRTILESIEDSYYEVDLKGNFTFFNRNLCKILGYTEEEIMGMNYRHYCSESTTARVFEAFNKVYRTKKPTKEFELEYIRKDKTTGHAEVSVSLMLDSKGKAYGFRGIIREISERKAAEIALQVAKEKYQMLIEKMEEGVVLEDKKGFFTFVNPQTITLLGYTEEEFLNKHWSKFIAPESLEIVTRETAKRPVGVGSRYEAIALGKNNQRIPLIISATPLHSKAGDFKGVLSVFTDITKLKKVEQQLRESEKRIQKIKLEEERYHAMASHFFNNDLQKIQFGLDLLLFNYYTRNELDQEMINRMVQIIDHSSRNLELVNKIFAVLQSELPRETKKVNALKIIKDIVKKFKFKSHLKIIDINESSLSRIELEVDNYLYDVFYELLFFILNYSVLESDKVELPVVIEGSLLPTHFCIIIRDNYSQPLPQLVSTQLMSSITEKWESRGHYLPIAFASVIMNYYDGKFKITPLDPRGNEFQLLFPIRLASKFERGKTYVSD